MWLHERTPIGIWLYFCSHRIGVYLLKADLSEREHTVLSFAAQGYTDEMVAHELGIKRGTVNSYWIRIRGKLGTLSRSELVARFVQHNADSEFSKRIATNEAEAESLALENRQILGKANEEIERLTKLLSKQKE